MGARDVERLNSKLGSISAYGDDNDSEYCSATDGLRSDDDELDGQHSSVTSDLESRSSLESGRIRKPSLNTSELRFPRRGVPSRSLDRDSDVQHPDHPDPSASTTGSAWYQFDTAVLVALLSPFGKWLTGGDHVKHLLFIALVVYYLHQVIEVPWTLYQKTLYQKRPNHDTRSSLQDKQRELAISEIRKIELYTMTLAALSPFIGAYLLRYAIGMVLGYDYISWFSTGLFIMATGIRPWSHLIERFNQRTTDLKDFIHHTSPHEPKETSASLLQRINDLEDSLAIVESLLKRMQEDTVDYVDKTVAGVKGSVRRNEKRCSRQAERLRTLERTTGEFFELYPSFGKKNRSVMSSQSVLSQVLSPSTLSSWISPEMEEYTTKYLKSIGNGNAADQEPPEALRVNHSVRFGLIRSLLVGIGHIVFHSARTVTRVLFG